MIDGSSIAIVEDDPDIRALLAGYLEGEGFEVVTLDGGSGLDRLQTPSRSAPAKNPRPCAASRKPSRGSAARGSS